MTTKKLNIKTRLFNGIRRLLMFRAAENKLSGAIRHGNNFAAKLAPNYYQYPKKSIRKTSINGVQLETDLSDYIGHFVYFGFADPGFERLVKLPVKGGTILDVGANIGYTALTLASNNDLPVVAFEPDPYNFSVLKKNCALNRQLKVNPVNLGLGSQKDRLKLAVVTPDNLGGNRISASAGKDFNLVDITTIDYYCSESAITDVGLIKIDVEGFEMEVLKGAVRTLTENRPSLFIEVNDNNLKEQGSSARELIAFLEPNYTILEDAASGNHIRSSQDFSNCHFDLIARN